MAARSGQEQNEMLGSTRQQHSNTTIPKPATISTTPTPSPRKRPGYARIPSVPVVEESTVRPSMDRDDEDDITQAPRISLTGLGISESDEPQKARRVSIKPLPRPILSNIIKDSPQQSTPGSTDPLISPPSTGRFSGSTQYYDSPHTFDTSYGGAHHLGKQSMSSLHSGQPSIFAKSDTSLLSLRSKYDEWAPEENCRSHKQVKQKMGTWLSSLIIALAVFSTVFSAAYLIIALRNPRYGRIIRTNGTLTASTAAFLTSLFAKLIELSFVTVLVAFIGQALARRAFTLEVARGVTLAELSMRSWVSQPGTLLTQWQSVRYAGVTWLGVISLVGAFSALLYTSAATALVQPQLKFSHWQNQPMQGLVKTEFANPTYIENNCQTPISSTYDPTYYGSTCIALEHAAMAYHNYFEYLGTWTEKIDNGSSPWDNELSNRPAGFALLTDNTTITAPWIEQNYTNMTKTYEDYGIVINNVSMAMPHPGVIQAAQDSKNNIMQPADLDNLGEYNIKASVPSPVVHVLCSTLNKTQLTPFVYDLWPNTSLSDINAFPSLLSAYPDYLSNPFLNHTPLHDIYKWGASYSPTAWPPVFPRLPIDYNTIINDTTGVAYGRDSIYLLGKGGETDSEGDATSGQNYALCHMKVSQTPFCSTQYNATSKGGTLEAVCEDEEDEFMYIRSVANATQGASGVSKDWVNIGSQWASSLALNDGTFNGNGSNARLVTQLILSTSAGPTLNPALPSTAEALAVMVGCTLLQSATSAPFVPYWNYTGATTISGQYQHFNASIRAQQYTSGGTGQTYQKAFYLILFLVFIMNVMALSYFLWCREWYTDFAEPSCLFALAVNSPPSRELAGSCGGGPEGRQYDVSWKLVREGGHVYMESQGGDDVVEGAQSPGLRRRRRRWGMKAWRGKGAGCFEMVGRGG